LGQQGQALIAGRMPMAIIERLEMVHIDQQHAQGQSLVAWGLPLLQQVVVQMTAIGNAGQRIATRQGIQLSL